ncbi:MAG: type II secretion system protein [Cyanobacteria bacterium CYA]|nr:MAG: type II secretion system protein [Cyanobacteria bacterium CYA]
MTRHARDPRLAFTLIELLVVIAIIGILIQFAPYRVPEQPALAGPGDDDVHGSVLAGRLSAGRADPGRRTGQPQQRRDAAQPPGRLRGRPHSAPRSFLSRPRHGPVPGRGAVLLPGRRWAPHRPVLGAIRHQLLLHTRRGVPVHQPGVQHADQPACGRACVGSVEGKGQGTPLSRRCVHARGRSAGRLPPAHRRHGRQRAVHLRLSCRLGRDQHDPGHRVARRTVHRHRAPQRAAGRAVRISHDQRTSAPT